MGDYLRVIALKIPDSIRKVILDEKLIDRATQVPIQNSPMHYLFEVHASYLDKMGEFDNWNCPTCRAHVFDIWHRIKPHLQQLEIEKNGKSA